VDLYKIDYDWVDQQESKRELRLALAALRKDGYFTDLMKHVEKRLKSIDSSYQTDQEKDYVDPTVAREANNDVLGFLKEMSSQDAKLRGKNESGEKVESKIFDEDEGEEPSNVSAGELAEKV
jgi:hypothetical protein